MYIPLVSKGPCMCMHACTVCLSVHEVYACIMHVCIYVHACLVAVCMCVYCLIYASYARSLHKYHILAVSNTA